MRITSLFLSLLISLSLSANSKAIFVIEIKGDITSSSFKRLSKGLQEAIDTNAHSVIIDLNTYGGAVDAADSMRSALLNFPLPTAVYINHQAVSAGALISIACDSIYMKKGGTIGAATVVDQTGAPMPDKYQSFMRAMMRATAEAKGRDPHIAEAMVDPTVHIEGIIDSTKVLSLTAEEAINANYCEGIALNLNDAAKQFNGDDDFTLIVQHLSFADKILLFFLSPVVQGLLLMLIIGGIYFEFQSPGIGLPSLVAGIAALLYFSPLYIEGLAQNWEIIIFVIGIILILVEIFVLPGFGVAGISGIVLAVVGLAFAMIDNDLFYYNGNYNFIVLIKPISIVLLSAFLGLSASIYLVGKLFDGNHLPGIALKTVLDEEGGFVVSNSSLRELSGKEGVVMTDMRPSGKVEIDGKWYEATMINGLARKGERIKVIRYEAGRLYCENLPQ